MSVSGVVDEVLAGLEPDPSRRDDSLAAPVHYEADRLYGWPRSERFDPEGTGEMDSEQFDIRLAWAVSAEDEVAAELRMRATSETIFARVASIATWLRANRTGVTYEHMAITTVDYEGLVTHSVRGFLMDLTGYQQQS